MVIQHNMNAMNASRQMGLVAGSLAKSTEKLSSGYKINRAADDAAGLSISEKMRKQIRGLDQASENIEDGISLCQVADGALNETVDILQRMRELAVQSANGTNSASDRQFIEMEITQLKSEVDRIAETTTFNNAVYPLNAPLSKHKESEVIVVGSANNVLPENKLPGVILHEATVEAEVSTTVAFSNLKYDGKDYADGDKITVTGIVTLGGNAVHVNDGAANYYPTRNQWFYWGSNEAITLRIADLKFDSNWNLYFDVLCPWTNKGRMYAFCYDPSLKDGINFTMERNVPRILEHGYHLLTIHNLEDSQKPVMQKPITMQVTNYNFSPNEATSIHAGASSSQTNKIPVHMVNATCKGLGINDVTTVTEDSSTITLVLLDRAIAKASSYRSAFGAAQNRLEHAKMIDDNTAENTQAAESQIRDTDMAAEMVRYANTNILTQAGQSMLAQANQSRQSVLSLIT